MPQIKFTFTFEEPDVGLLWERRIWVTTPRLSRADRALARQGSRDSHSD